MVNNVNLRDIHDALLKTIDEDPDLQVKTLISVHFAQKNVKELIILSKSSHTEVREIVALSLQEYSRKVEIIDPLLEWFENEKDEATIEKLFYTLSKTFQLTFEEEKLKKAGFFLEGMIDSEVHPHFSLQLLGYCPMSVTENFFLEKLKKYRFNNKVRQSLFKGIYNFGKKYQQMPDSLQNKLIEVVGTTYETPELRKICLEALGEIKNQEVIDLLEFIIETDHNPFLRKRGVEILGKWQVVELSSLLINKLRFDGIPDVRAACALSLGLMASFEALPDLSEALELDPSFSVREAAAEALGNLKSQQAIAALVRGLEDQDSYVRSTSAWSIEQLKPDKELIIKVCKAVESTEQDINIRTGMITVLARMNTIPDTVKCLTRLFKKDRTPIRELILEALENFVPFLRKNDSFLENDLSFILETLVKSSSFSLRAAICTFLGHLKVDSTFTFLLDRLKNDNDLLVKRQAAWGISNLGFVNHKEIIYSLLDDKDYRNLVPLLLEILTAWCDIEDVNLAINYLKPECEVDWRIRAVELLTAIISSTRIELSEKLTSSMIHTMTKLLKNDPASNVRAASAYSLGHFSVNEEYDALILPTLLDAIKTEKIYTVRELAAQAIGYRGQGDNEVVIELFKLINYDLEKDPSIRYFAALALLNYEENIRNSSKNNKESTIHQSL
ncbi:MAG: HEAT repeat domain-containing protein [Candidatus Hodarchaeota archaeon]